MLTPTNFCCCFAKNNSLDYTNRHLNLKKQFSLEGDESLLTGSNMQLINNTLLGKAFRSMTSLTRLKKSRGNIFKKFEYQISAITYKNDYVISSQKVFETIKVCPVEEWNFKFNYTHGLTYPVLPHALKYLVDKTFDRIYMKAALFLT
jgi:hypothetical protein